MGACTLFTAMSPASRIVSWHVVSTQYLTKEWMKKSAILPSLCAVATVDQSKVNRGFRNLVTNLESVWSLFKTQSQIKVTTYQSGLKKKAQGSMVSSTSQDEAEAGSWVSVGLHRLVCPFQVFCSLFPDFCFCLSSWPLTESQVTDPSCSLSLLLSLCSSP